MMSDLSVNCFAFISKLLYHGGQKMSNFFFLYILAFRGDSAVNSGLRTVDVETKPEVEGQLFTLGSH